MNCSTNPFCSASSPTISKAPQPPYQRYAQPASLPIGPYVAASLLQKAIRRGRLALALQAAATLLAKDPPRLWRRLACIAAEDVGLGDLNALGLATAALAKRRRVEAGGDWLSACCVAAALAAAPKCRSADDLLMTVRLHPAFGDSRAALGALPVAELIKIVLSAEPLLERALALCAALGVDWRARRSAERRVAAQTLFDAFNGAGWSWSLVEIARQNFARTGELLAPLVVLLSREAKEPVAIEADEAPLEAMIGPVPAWAYDLYSREGRAALALFLRGGAPSAAWLRRQVPFHQRLGVLGHALFRIEGGLVDNRLKWPLGEWLRREVDVACAGPGCKDVSELLALVKVDISRLNAVRAELCHAAAAVAPDAPPASASAPANA